MVIADRRQVLAGVGVLLGLSFLPAQALAAAPAAPAFFDKQAAALLAAFADTLIPRTDTPGAIDVGVPATFDLLMRDWASGARRTAFLAALGAIDAEAKARTGKPFAQLTPAARQAVLEPYDAQHNEGDMRYAALKDLVVNLYYLSEPGATVELRYEHAPGVWEASTPLTAATRAWAGAMPPGRLLAIA
ncbi:MAG TPA: gluconate 2-dehydrogenase subunit 3 family protein [Novosphingobium sp.]|nr:gluconate 2-dehydrogenase subunit 3 family protein [Novosphingobium sp.]